MVLGKILDAIARADYSALVWTVRNSDSRREEMIVRVLPTAIRALLRSVEHESAFDRKPGGAGQSCLGEGRIPRGQTVVPFFKGAGRFPTNSQLQRELPADAPRIVGVQVRSNASIPAERSGLGSRSGMDGNPSRKADAVPYPVFDGEPVVARRGEGKFGSEAGIERVSGTGAIGLRIVPLDPARLAAETERVCALDLGEIAGNDVAVVDLEDDRGSVEIVVGDDIR